MLYDCSRNCVQFHDLVITHGSVVKTFAVLEANLSTQVMYEFILPNANWSSYSPTR